MVIFLFFANLAGIVQSVSAQSRVDFSDISVDYLYGEEVVFQAKVQPVSMVKEV
jgi:hypothetical protein